MSRALAWRGSEGFDLIVVSDVDPILLTFSLSRGVTVVADLHEYVPGEFALNSVHSKAMSRYRSPVCRKFLARCAGITVASGSVDDLYRSDSGVD